MVTAGVQAERQFRPALPGFGRPRKEAVQRSEPRALLGASIVVTSAILVATAVGSSIAATAAGYAALGLAVLNPLFGIAVLLLHAPFQELTGFGPFGFHGMLAIAILVGCVAGLARQRPVVRIDPLWAIFIAFGAMALVQVLLIGNDPGEMKFTFASIQLVGLATGGALLLAAQLLFRDRDWGPFLDIIVLSGVLAASLALASLATNGRIDTQFPGIYAVGVNNERAIGPFNNPNYFGLFEALVMVVAFYRLRFASKKMRVLLALAMPIIVLALVVSFSRAALLSAGIGVTVLALSFNVRAAIGVGAVLVVAGILISGAFSSARFSITNPNGSIGDQIAAQEASDNARFTAGGAGVSLFESAPVFGIGFGQYHFESVRYLPPASETSFSHDWYVNLLAEQGIVGVVLVVAAALIVGWRIFVSTRERRILCVGLMAAYLVGNAFTESPTYLGVSAAAWFVVGATIAVRAARDPAPHANAQHALSGAY